MNRFKPRIFKYVILIFLISIFIVILNIFVGKNNNFEKGFHSNIEIGGEFELTDINKSKFKSSEIKKLKLIYFGYSFCPDVCPIDLMKVTNFFNKNLFLLEKIKPIFITVDPERDTPENLRDFMDNFGKYITALTGSKIEIDELLKKYRIYKKKSGDDENFYTIDHTSLFYLTNVDDIYITHFSTKAFEEEFFNFLSSNGFL